MVYVPNATDATQPTGSVDASTADDEFRTLKAYVLGLALTAGMFAPVRQTVNDGAINATGDPAFFKAAVAGGLALDLVATGRPLVANFAGGSTGTGVNDRNSTLTGDTAGILAGLAPSNTSYIYADYVSAAAMTWGSTLAPVQYGKVYPQSIGSILQFAGAAGSTVFLDDFGNTWTAQSGARVQTNQIKFGTGALGGQGAANVLNGTSDYIKSTSFTTLGSGGWALRAWVYATVLPTAGNIGGVIEALNAGGFGARLVIQNVAAVIKFTYYLSSAGAAFDIAAGVAGTTTPVINTWYFVELTYDALAGIYRLYVNGVQENSTASALKTSSVTSVSCGGNGNALNFLQGYIDKPEILSYCQHPGGVAYAVPTGAPLISAAGYAPDAFDIQAMKMYSVTGPSGVAGVPPTTNQKYRVYLGEADTNALVPTVVRNYAFNGRYQSADVALVAAGTGTSFQHNLGVLPLVGRLYIKNLTTESGYTSGNITEVMTRGAASINSSLVFNFSDKNTASVLTGTNTNYIIITRTTGADSGLSIGNWRQFAVISRGWGGA